MKCQSAAQYFVLVVSITTKRVVQSEKKNPTNWEEISPFYRGDFHHWKENAFPITWLRFKNRAITAQQSLVLHVSSTRYIFAASLIVALSK